MAEDANPTYSYSSIFGVPLIQLNLETVDLNDNPEFMALSYTWGSPCPYSSHENDNHERSNDTWPVC